MLLPLAGPIATVTSTALRSSRTSWSCTGTSACRERPEQASHPYPRRTAWTYGTISSRTTSRPAPSRDAGSRCDAARSAALADPNAECLGLDGKMLPVVKGWQPGPSKTVTWALLRNGAPTKVTKPLAEVWR